MLAAAVLIGGVAGLRALTAPAAVSWAAPLGWLKLDGTWLAFGYSKTPYILSVLAIVELATDQLPSTPSRKVPMQFGARIVTGAFSGAAIGSPGGAWIGGLVAGAVGAVAGTLGGYEFRTRPVLETRGKDLADRTPRGHDRRHRRFPDRGFAQPSVATDERQAGRPDRSRINCASAASRSTSWPADSSRTSATAWPAQTGINWARPASSATCQSGPARLACNGKSTVSAPAISMTKRFAYGAGEAPGKGARHLCRIVGHHPQPRPIERRHRRLRVVEKRSAELRTARA